MVVEQVPATSRGLDVWGRRTGTAAALMMFTDDVRGDRSGG
jgi:hypothetical protein